MPVEFCRDHSNRLQIQLRRQVFSRRFCMWSGAGESCFWVQLSRKMKTENIHSSFLQVYDVKDKSVMEFSDKLPEKVLDLIWSAQDYKLMVVLDRNVILYEVAPQDYRLISTLYMSVDKLVCNYTFSKIVTVDNIGNFYVLKHPL